MSSKTFYSSIINSKFVFSSGKEAQFGHEGFTTANVKEQEELDAMVAMHDTSISSTPREVIVVVTPQKLAEAKAAIAAAAKAALVIEEQVKQDELEASKTPAQLASDARMQDLLEKAKMQATQLKPVSTADISGAAAG